MPNAFSQLRLIVDELAKGEVSREPVPILQGMRSGASPETSYDNQVLLENPVASHAPGTFRPHWQGSPRAVFASVASIKTSATPSVNTSTYAYKTGIHNSPTTTNTAFTVVPDMSVSLQASASVRVNFVGTFQTATANDTAGFAIFRDNKQISRTFQGSSALANTPFTIHIFVTDQPVAGVRVYDIRWAAGANTLQATGLSRSIEAQNLRAV